MCDYPVIFSDNLNEGVRITPLNWIYRIEMDINYLIKKGTKPVILWKLQFVVFFNWVNITHALQICPCWPQSRCIMGYAQCATSIIGYVYQRREFKYRWEKNQGLEIWKISALKNCIASSARKNPVRRCI